MAWHYVKYSDDPKLADAELKDRTPKRGLWANPNAIPPWDWRRLSKEEKARARGTAPVVFGYDSCYHHIDVAPPGKRAPQTDSNATIQ